MKIQTLDLKDPELSNKLLLSLKNTGFAIIKNHDISKELLGQTYTEWAKFFASEEKHKHLFDPKTQTGYFPFRSENAKNSKNKDLKEFFHLFNPFTESPNSMSLNTLGLATGLLFLGHNLLSQLDHELTKQEVLNANSQSLLEMVEGSQGTLFRVIHYPPLQGAVPGEVRAAAHEDINLITLLPAATEPGLEVRDNEGNWHPVECDPGTVVINAGDMLSELTGGYIKSTTHRVINPQNNNISRYSMPLFIHPRFDVKLSAKYTAGEYLNERLREIGLIKGE